MTTISPSLPSITSNVAVSLPKQSTRKKKTRLLRIQCRVDEKSTSTDKAGAGLSWVSPDWLTSFMKMRTGPDESGIPMANAKLDDVKDLLGGALFLPLFKWMKESGPVYRLAAGPRNFVVISDPEAAKHVLRNYGKYGKGLVSEVSQFLFGSGFAIAEGELWMIDLLCKIIPRQIKAAKAVSIIRECVEELIVKCKAIVEAEGEKLDGEEYVNQSDPSILRFLLASREEVSSVQLRDDLLSMLVAGHETTGSVLTWTIYLLSQNPTSLKKAQEEVDRVLQGRNPQVSDMKELKYLTRCINESMRLYPHPPVLIRRAQEADILPGGYKVDVGQDIMISVYNIHHSPMVWDMADEFIPERFDLNGPVPNETNTDFRFIPFSGGPRKCVGDQFALLESLVALSILLQNFNFELVPNQTIGMTTGATIHTTTGLYMSVTKRQNRVLELTII
ncbi:carotene epsilon-monooxygenase, chloroplastic isoform X3 [Cryptomeria japonica]|uniref:carotene epsilon-monooxygenase, chloroplastic isoform X3 n=1 Tax=Cryptomeria japonica TaxID=3369 RepID=UPI0027DA3061|nr:carotene epsilon-monooxygenase, chloroplastic isoform X3 [Cryptomeria japonica]